MIIPINVNPLQPDIEGLFNAGDTVIVKCDATDATFTTLLPDATTTHQVTFKIVKTDNSSNDVILGVRVTGQKISGELTQQLSIQGEMIIFNSDRINWW